MLSPARSDSPQPAEERFRVRLGRSADVEYVAEMGARAFAAFGGSYDRYLTDWFRDESVTTLVGEAAGRPRGFSMVAFYDDPDRPGTLVSDLVSIAVEADHRGRGLGSLLLDASIDRARVHRPGVEAMWLVVADDNARAAKLFSSRGFRDGPGVGVYPSGQRALRMILRLAPDDGCGERGENP